MLTYFQLMHKDTVCGILSVDPENNSLEAYASIDRGCAPFLGNADTRLMKKWWEARSIPASRNFIRELLRRAGFATARDYMIKNLALSLTDTYWIQPFDAGLKWKDIKLYDNKLLNNHAGKDSVIPFHHDSSYDPNASLGGQMEKYWDTSCRPPVLVKTAYANYGQQAINEAFATLLHRRQEAGIPYVEYTLKRASDNGLLAMCDAFTSEEREFVSAMEILDSRKVSRSQSPYNAIISICADGGIDEEQMRDFMDYQTLTDFVISNTDEHLMNFGVLRDSETLRLISPAPIFDSGNSMFFGEGERRFTKQELLERTITGLYDREEKILRRVKKRSIVKVELLPSAEEVLNFYVSNGLPEGRAAIISQNYEQKKQLLAEFQAGKKITAHFAAK